MDLHSLLKLVVHKKASDLFITSGLAPTLKIDGRIVPVSDTLLTPEDTRDFVLGVMKSSNAPTSATSLSGSRDSAVSVSARSINAEMWA